MKILVWKEWKQSLGERLEICAHDHGRYLGDVDFKKKWD